MDLKHFFVNYASVIEEYLEFASNIAVLVIDNKQLIIDCNHCFTNMLGQHNNPLGKNINDYLSFQDYYGSLAPVDKPAEGPGKATNYQIVRLNFVKPPSTVQTMDCYLFNVGSYVLLFCEKQTLSNDEIITKLSILNAEMAQLTRELNRKNIELEKANETITRMLNTDYLTGLANRRFFQESLEKAFSYARRKNEPLALIMADLDNFKIVNDNYGHDIGDQVLIEFARQLQNSCRKEDTAARFGGEEFVVLLPGTTAREAASQAERIRQAVMLMEIPGLPGRITASFGVAELSDDDSIYALIKKADLALYEAKSTGRNSVVF